MTIYALQQFTTCEIRRMFLGLLRCIPPSVAYFVAIRGAFALIFMHLANLVLVHFGLYRLVIFFNLKNKFTA